MKIQQETFEAWLFSQPDERTYDYLNINNCLICNFAHETTNKKLRVSYDRFYLQEEKYEKAYQFDDWLMRLMRGCHITKLGYISVGTLHPTFKHVKAIYVSLYGEVETKEISIPHS